VFRIAPLVSTHAGLVFVCRYADVCKNGALRVTENTPKAGPKYPRSVYQDRIGSAEIELIPNQGAWLANGSGSASKGLFVQEMLYMGREVLIHTAKVHI